MFLKMQINENTRRMVFEDSNSIAAIVGDSNVDGVIFYLPENSEYFEFRNAVVFVIFFDITNKSHKQVLDQVDDYSGMPKWVFDDNVLKNDVTGQVSFFLHMVISDTSGTVLKSWNTLPSSIVVYKNRDYDNQEEEATRETDIDRLAGLVVTLTEKAQTIGDVEKVLASITGSAPKPVDEKAKMIDDGHIYLYTGDENNFVTGALYYYVDGTLTYGGIYGSYDLDKTLTETGKAADAGAVGAAIDEVKEDLNSKTGLSEEAKQALLACFAKVAWMDEHGQDYYDALEDALYPPAVLTSISAVYTQSGTVYNTASLDSLKADLVVTGHYSDGTYRDVSGYTLSGTLTVGTSTITVSYSGKTTTFSVTVTQARVPEGFREVEWIGSGTGNLGMYIGNDSFRLPSAFRAEAKTQLTGWNEGAAYGNVIAVFQPSASTYGYELAYKKEDSTIVSFLGAQSVVTPSDINAEIVLGTVCNGTTEQAYMVVNGERVYGASVSVSRNYTGAKVGVFAGGNTVVNQLVGKLFYLNIYDSTDALVAELIPCYRVSDGAIGLYDTVADGFLTNANDTYTKGDDV